MIMFHYVYAELRSLVEVNTAGNGFINFRILNREMASLLRPKSEDRAVENCDRETYTVLQD